ncbi:MAG: NAD(P)H-dependent oxidoreductase subunit E [Dehalococcoidia bacterium]|jgi:NADH-quinone oxidoreductase subunit E
MKQVDKVLASYNNDKNALIQILLEIQKENRWLSEDVLRKVSKKLDVPINQIYHIATFYKAFSLVPHGRHSVSVCLGTACHVRGAPRLLDKVSEVVGLKPGETSKDMKYSLNTLNCLGCCALGPVLQIDDEYYSNPSSTELKKIIAECD